MTQIWTQDLDESVYTDAAIADTKAFVGIPLSSGITLVGRFPLQPAVELRSGERYADFVMAGPMFLVSAKLKAILERFDVNTEFFLVSTDTPAEMYFCNFRESVDCLNRNGSVFTEEGDFATNIERVELDSMSHEPPVYRVAMTIPVIIAVRDDVATAVHAEGITGVVMKAPSDWTNPMYPA